MIKPVHNNLSIAAPIYNRRGDLVFTDNNIPFIIPQPFN